MIYKDILINPIVTERTSQLTDSNQLVFKVSTIANKMEIKKAIEQITEGRKVISVRTLMMPEVKLRRGKTRRVVVKSGWKKAIVSLSAEAKKEKKPKKEKSKE